jgi:hypothetical protein
MTSPQPIIVTGQDALELRTYLSMTQSEFGEKIMHRSREQVARNESKGKLVRNTRSCSIYHQIRLIKQQTEGKSIPKEKIVQMIIQQVGQVSDGASQEKKNEH